ncbi:hypothetical protein V8F20_003990 [Naviculisporaceae sp. PSN 640]
MEFRSTLASDTGISDRRWNMISAMTTLHDWWAHDAELLYDGVVSLGRASAGKAEHLQGTIGTLKEKGTVLDYQKPKTEEWGDWEPRNITIAHTPPVQSSLAIWTPPQSLREPIYRPIRLPVRDVKFFCEVKQDNTKFGYVDDKNARGVNKSKS